jgi:hypothetical protein
VFGSRSTGRWCESYSVMAMNRRVVLQPLLLLIPSSNFSHYYPRISLLCTIHVALQTIQIEYMSVQRICHLEPNSGGRAG